MKNRFVRVSVVTIIVSILYFTFFTNKATDIPKTDNSVVETFLDSIIEPDTIFYSKGYLVMGKPNEVLLIKKKDTLDIKYKNYNRLASYKDEVLLMKNKDSKYSPSVYRKYNPSHDFENYKVTVYQGKLADPDFTTNPDAKMFTTRITEGCKDGINFAGHYTLIYWGCGTECQYGVVVNRKTGRIYDGYQTSMGAKYQKDSKLIIKNYYLIADDGFFPLNHYAKITTELWKGDKFVGLD